MTRKLIIDKALRASGWRFASYRDGVALAPLNRFAVEKIPTATGPAYYPLVLDGLVISVAEAPSRQDERIEPDALLRSGDTK